MDVWGVELFYLCSTKPPVFILTSYLHLPWKQILPNPKPFWGSVEVDSLASHYSSLLQVFGFLLPQLLEVFQKFVKIFHPLFPSLILVYVCLENKKI